MLAYHEISAFIADHFKYHEQYSSADHAISYVGPWQDLFRDIDPTHAIRSLPLARGSRNSGPAWWTPDAYSNWQSERSGSEWASDAGDFPNVARFFCVKDSSGVSWLTAHGVYLWERKRLPSQEHQDAEHRKLWLKFRAFLVKKHDVEAFLQWADRRGVGEHWISSSLPHNTNLFLGEYTWSEAARLFDRPDYGKEGWGKPSGCPVPVLSIPVGYIEESTTFDCSMEEGFELTLPCDEIIRDWNLRWTGVGTDYVDDQRQVVAMDPSAHEPGDNALLLREDAFQRYLEARQLTIVWALHAEKECIGPEYDAKHMYWTRFSGAYALKDGDFVGTLNTEHKE